MGIRLPDQQRERNANVMSIQPFPTFPNFAAASPIATPDIRATATKVGAGAGGESDRADTRFGGCARKSEMARKRRRDDGLAARLRVSGRARKDRIGLSPAQ